MSLVTELDTASVIKELYTGTGNNKNNKVKCIWDADNDGCFSKADVDSYIAECFPDLNAEQINNALKNLQGEFNKKIKYNLSTKVECTNLVRNAIEKVKSCCGNATSQQAADIIKDIENNTKRILLFAQSKGYNPHLKINNSQINNAYYKGKAFDIEYDGLNVTVKNKQNGKKHSLNLYILLKDMNDSEIIKFLLFIQRQPGEVLEDLAIEMDDILSPTGRDMHVRDNQAFVAGGYYTPSSDTIVTSPAHLVHELGHAVDYSGKNNESSCTNNPKYMQSFREELAKYKQAGNIQYDYNNQSTWMQGDKYNYCTANEYELFAESYNLAMTGRCRSEKVITTYFPKTFEIALEIINQTREKSDLDRRYTPIRKFSQELANIFK